MSHGAEVFFVQVTAWDDGDDELTGALPDVVQQRQRLAEQVERALPTVRSQIALVSAVRGEVQGLLSAVQLVQRVEDVEIIPSVLSGRRTTSTQASDRVAERYKTSDDVARSLRMARPAELARPPKEPEPQGLLGAFKKLFRRD